MIEVKNSSIIIRNKSLHCLPKSYSKLVNEFSVYDEVAHTRDTYIPLDIGDDIYLPATISINTISGIYPDKKVVYNDRSPDPEKIDISMINEPRPNQIDAIYFLTSIETSDFRHRMVVANTGIGKTYCTINAISQIGVKAIIIVDRDILLEQWINQFCEHSTITRDDIFVISGAKSLEDIKTTNFKIAIAQHKTLTMAIKKDPNILNEIIIETGIGIRVFDEVHKNFISTCNNLSLCNVLYNFYLTATPNRSDWRESKLWHKVFDSVPKYVGVEQQPHVKTIMLNYNTQPTYGMVAHCTTKYGFSDKRYAAYLLNHKFSVFYKSLRIILDSFKIIESGKKTAIILPLIDLINKTYECLTDDYCIDIGVLTSEIKNKKKRQEAMDKQIFIATESMFGTGMDVSDLEIVINYSPFASKVTTEQLIGRLRNNAGYEHILYDVTDIGFDKCTAHMRTRKSIYNKKSAEVIVVSANILEGNEPHGR